MVLTLHFWDYDRFNEGDVSLSGGLPKNTANNIRQTISSDVLDSEDSAIQGIPENVEIDDTEEEAPNFRHPLASVWSSDLSGKHYATNSHVDANTNTNWSLGLLYSETDVMSMKYANDKMRNCQHPYPRYPNLEAALRARASKDKFVVLAAVIDSGYLMLAENLYITSFRRTKVQNYLFICGNYAACEEARARCLPVYLYRNASHTDSGGMNSPSFREKSMLKLYMVQEVIHLGYTVFLTDLDVFFFRNPVPKILDLCHNRCDILGQRDVGDVINTGFMLLRPTNITKAFYQFMLTHPRMKEFLHDQTLFNYFFPIFRSKERQTHVTLLSEAEFPEGRIYFIVGRRFFYDSKPCPSCYEVHNNWVVGTETKILRFKEHLMWMVDGDERYYSHPDRKYFTYDNPGILRSSHDYITWESEGFFNAIMLGQMLNRTLILPRFHGNSTFVAPFNSVYRINTLLRYYASPHLLRESSFLINPLVPDPVKNSISPLLDIERQLHSGSKGLISIFPSEEQAIHWDKSVLFEKWIGQYDTYSIIRFTSLYHPSIKYNLTHVLQKDPKFIGKMKFKAIKARWPENGIKS